MSNLATARENTAIGLRLAAIRIASKLSQSDFADSLGVSPRAYQNYERGELEIQVIVVRALYETYGADPVWLLVGPGHEPRRYGADLQVNLLERLIDEVETRLIRSRRKLPTANKARLVALLYTQFRDKPQLDIGYLERALALTA